MHHSEVEEITSLPKIAAVLSRFEPAPLWTAGTGNAVGVSGTSPGGSRLAWRLPVHADEDRDGRPTGVGAVAASYISVI
jgi:hypothetical protein